MNYIYGDGCTNPFFIDNLNKWDIFRKKGTSIQNIVDDKNNSMRKDMLRRKNEDTNIIFFILGQIDVFYNYYQFRFEYGKEINEENLIEEYIVLLNNIQVDNKKKIVCSVLPMNAGEKEFSRKVRDKYSIKNLNKKELKYFSHNNIFKRRTRFNEILKKYCKIYGIRYINCDRELLNKDNRLKNKFLTKDRYSLHFIWEYQLEVITKKLSKYGIKKFIVDSKMIKIFSNKKSFI